MDSTIIVGTHVAFDSDHGPQTGRVTAFIKCIENGQPNAMIEIDHELDGIIWTMPVAALKPSHVNTI